MNPHAQTFAPAGGAPEGGDCRRAKNLIAITALVMHYNSALLADAFDVLRQAGYREEWQQLHPPDSRL